MQWLTPAAGIERVMLWARKKGLVVFIDTDNALKIYPKSNPAWRQVELMLVGRHPEVKMHLIKVTKEGEE